MDEGDRPGVDGDPADRTESSNGDRDERDEDRDERGEDRDERGEDRDERGEDRDERGETGPVEPADRTDPAETTESVGSRGESALSASGDTGGGRPGGDRSESDPEGRESLVHRFRHDREGALMWAREMLSSVAIVLAIGLVLFGVSGVWPPMVAVESGSMEPNMQVGDLVFVTEPGRLAPDAADNDVGVVTYENGQAVDYRTFGSYGSVIIYRPPGRTASPIIHRAMFHVEEGENWYDRADDEHHSADGCTELRHCPAPHDGFITLGDNNAAYDQANGLAAPVRAEWVTGVARVRVPYLGYVRLIASGQAELGDVVSTVVPSVPDAAGSSSTVYSSGAVGSSGAVDGFGPIGFDGVEGSETVGDPTVSGGASVSNAAA